MNDPMSKALAALQERIRAGQEFPDASVSVALRFGVFIDELRDAYDEADCARLMPL
jgi:hypothetical protein